MGVLDRFTKFVAAKKYAGERSLLLFYFTVLSLASSMTFVSIGPIACMSIVDKGMDKLIVTFRNN